MLLAAGALLWSFSPGRPASAELRGKSSFPVNAGASDLRDITTHNSPTIAQNPKNPRAMAISNRIDSPNFACALHISSDAGATWAQTPLPVPAGQEESKCYAPDVTFGADGTLSLVFVTLQGVGNVPNAVWFVTSKDNGMTLSDPVQVGGEFSFQVRLVADPTTAGRLYMSWVQATSTALYALQPPNPVVVSRSDDGGTTWSAPTPVSSPSRQRVIAPSMAVGDRGQVYIVYTDLGEDKLDYEGGHGGYGGEPYPGAWQLVTARSLDGGATWSETIVEKRLGPIERLIVFIPKFPSIAVDRSTGQVYIAFHDSRRGPSDVYVWTSDDDGATFSPGRRVNDTPASDRTSQLLPALAVAPDGRLDVLYYDRRGDPKDVLTEVSLQSSFDHGKTFEPRVRLTPKPFDSGIGSGSERQMPDIGSRLALLPGDNQALGVWTDTGRGTQSSNKQDQYRAVVDISPPAQLATPVRTGLRATGAVLILAALALAFGGSARGHARPGPQPRTRASRQKARRRRAATPRTRTPVG